eukprot:4586113-Prymnesium_polylepis.2
MNATVMGSGCGSVRSLEMSARSGKLIVRNAAVVYRRSARTCALLRPALRECLCETKSASIMPSPVTVSRSERTPCSSQSRGYGELSKSCFELPARWWST